MKERPVIIPLGDDCLIADLHAGGEQAVLVLPGWSGTRYGPQRILLHTAHGLAAQGFTTLRLDFRGRGDSTGANDFATLDSMIEDTVTAVNWLREQHGVRRVSLAGLCSGSNVALGAASLLTDVEAVICWSLLPFMEHKTQAAKQGTPRGKLLRQFLRKAVRPETWRKLLRGEANVRGAVKTIAKDKEGSDEEKRRKTSRRDILADLAGYSGHLYLLYGSNDPEAAGSQAFFESWARRNNIPVTTRVVQGAPHNFYTAHWTDTVVTQTVEWLAR